MLTAIWLNKWIHSSDNEKLNLLISENDEIDYQEASKMLMESKHIDTTIASSAYSLRSWDVSLTYSRTIYALIDLEIKSAPLWNYTADIQLVYNIITKAISRSEVLEGRTVFYHAQKLTFGILDIALKYAYMRAGLPPKLHGIFSRLSMRTLPINQEIFDYEDDLQPYLVSTNYSIFGNFGARYIGESSLHYMIHDYSQTDPTEYVQYIPFMSEVEKEQLRDLITYFDKLNHQNNRPGRLLLFALSNKGLEKKVYNAHVGGSFAPMPILEFIKSYPLLSLSEINEGQARIFNLTNEDVIEVVDDGLGHEYGEDVKGIFNI